MQVVRSLGERHQHRPDALVTVAARDQPLCEDRRLRRRPCHLVGISGCRRTERTGETKGDIKTLFALYSATHEKFFQSGAYSTDKGRTWTKINGGKPVIPHQDGFSKGQRDPRVFYYAPGKCYYTIMMIGGPERKVRLWKSTNLLDWEHAFDIPNKAAECIDMYRVAVDGDPNNRNVGYR